MVKTKKIEIRVTEQELELVRLFAKNDLKNVSEFIIGLIVKYAKCKSQSNKEIEKILWNML